MLVCTGKLECRFDNPSSAIVRQLFHSTHNGASGLRLRMPSVGDDGDVVDEGDDDWG